MSNNIIIIIIIAVVAIWWCSTQSEKMTQSDNSNMCCCANCYNDPIKGPEGCKYTWSPKNECHGPSGWNSHLWIVECVAAKNCGH